MIASIAKWGGYVPVWYQMYLIYPNSSRITPWGCTEDLTWTPLKWWRGNPRARDNSVQESRLYQKTWIWPKDSREAPQSIRTQWNWIINPMCISKPRVVMEISGGSTNLDRNGEYVPAWRQNVTGQKIKWAQIIPHRMRDPSHPCLQLNQTHRSKGHLLAGKHDDI